MDVTNNIRRKRAWTHLNFNVNWGTGKQQNTPNTWCAVYISRPHPSYMPRIRVHPYHEWTWPIFVVYACQQGANGLRDCYEDSSFGSTIRVQLRHIPFPRHYFYTLWFYFLYVQNQISHTSGLKGMALSFGELLPCCLKGKEKFLCNILNLLRSSSVSRSLVSYTFPIRLT